MKYSRKQFGLELKEKINNCEPFSAISSWAYSVYMDTDGYDPDLDEFLLDLYAIGQYPNADGYSSDELLEIAEDFMDDLGFTRRKFGKELRDKIEDGVPVSKIGRWVHYLYVDRYSEIDRDFKNILERLGWMDGGPEYERSYENLLEIAEALISGNEVKL